MVRVWACEEREESMKIGFRKYENEIGKKMVKTRFS